MNQTESKTTLEQFTIKRAIIYARVSTDEQAESGTSLDNQVEKSLEYAQANNLHVMGIFKEDYTGTTLDRPELNKVREMFRAGLADALIVYKTNRLDRSEWGVNLLVLLQELKTLDVELHYSQNKRQINLNNPVEALMQSIEGWQAGEDRNEVVRRLCEGREKRVKQGGVMVSKRPPYGYNLVKDGNFFKLEIKESEAQIVRLIFNWYIRGDKGIPFTMMEIQRRLQGMGIPSPAKGKKIWGIGSIKFLLTNQTYAGTWHFNKATRTTNGKLVTRDKSDWLPVEVPPIIDLATLEIAKKRLKENEHRAGRTPKHKYLLNRRLHCRCGYKIIVQKGGKELAYQYYICPGRQNKELRPCDLPYFPGEKVDTIIWNWVKGFFDDEQRLRAGIDEYHKRQASIAKPLEQELETLKDLIRETETKLTQNRKALVMLEGSKAERTKATILADIERLETTLDILEGKQNEVEAKLRAATLTEADIQEIIDQVNYIRQEVGEGLDLANASIDHKKWLIERLNVEATLFVENGEKMIEARCYFGDKHIVKLSSMP